MRFRAAVYQKTAENCGSMRLIILWLTKINNMVFGFFEIRLLYCWQINCLGVNCSR